MAELMEISDGDFYRTCQECGHKQLAREPKSIRGELSPAYANAKCKRCKSPALDYGRTKTTDEDVE